MAGVMITKLSGEQDSLYGKILAPLRQVLIDAAGDKTDDEQLLKSFMIVNPSNGYGEAFTGQTGLSQMKPTVEGGKVDNDSFTETWSKTIEHTTFKNRIVLSAEMIEDATAGYAVRKAKPLFEEFGTAYVSSRVNFATLAVCSEGDATFVYNGKTFDRTTGDGKALFSTTHKVKKTGAANISNLYANLFGSDTVMLNRLANVGRNIPNETGNATRYLFDTIMIPGNCPALEDTIKKVIATERAINSANNDVNTQFGRWQLVVNPYWQAGGTNANPYILMSSRALKATTGNAFFDRTPLKVKERVDDDENLILSARARWSAGFPEWRHMIMGGVTGGTTLS